MDYSSSLHDADHPVEASPWGSSPASSPEHGRTTFAASSGDVPPPHSPYRDHHSEGNGDYNQDENPIGSGGYNRPENNTFSGGDDGEIQRPATAESVEQTQQPLAHGQQYQQGHQQPVSQQYPPGARQGSRPQGPQYKLQAKITGLERTGRKDPILRFDVHVCNASFWIMVQFHVQEG
jgi:hypothetical protein